MGEIELLTIGILAIVGLVAGFIDAIAGGGGLLAIPALLTAGLDPVSALATNKLQSSFGSFSATTAYARARLIEWREALPMAATAFVGSVAGALFVNMIPTHYLAGIMPIMLIMIAIYFMISPSLRLDSGIQRISPRAFTFTFALGIGFYDGCFGPGTGSFLMIGFVSLLGFSIIRATAHTKLLNFASNLGALLLFTATGSINLVIGLAMGAGQYIGAQLGARLAMRKGALIIRPLLVIVCCTMAARLLIDPANPLHNAIIRSIEWISLKNLIP